MTVGPASVRKCAGRLASCTALAILGTVGEPAFADWCVSAEVKQLVEKAEAGDAGAQMRVASAYDTGHGAPRDGAEAMKWYRRAADQGLAEAQNSVGSDLQARKQYAEALLWYEKAAAQGHALATNNLAYLYDTGTGTERDQRKAVELYLRSADLGWAEAMWNLANVYGSGQLGEKEMLAACAWTLRARAHAPPENRRLVAYSGRATTYFETTLDGIQWERCKKTASEWTPSRDAAIRER